MITANEARTRSHEVDTNNFWINSIIAKVFDAIAYGETHCQWYTPVRYDCLDSEIEVISKLKETLETDYGYHCKLEVLTPNNSYRSSRVKMYINWD